jgi:hypothetical protein
MAEHPIKLATKKSIFMEQVKALLPEGGNLSLCLTCSSHTIFHYFAENIHPGKSGDVRCFRLECRDLAEQIRDLDQWRAQQHRLKRIK